MSYYMANDGYSVRGPGLRQGRRFEVLGLGAYGVYGLGAYGVYGLGDASSWRDDVLSKWFQFKIQLQAAMDASNAAEGNANAATYANNMVHLDVAALKAADGQIPYGQFQRAGEGVMSALSRPVDSTGQMLWAQLVEAIQNAPSDVARILGKAAKAGAEGADVNLGLAAWLVPTAVGLVALAYLFKK